MILSLIIIILSIIAVLIILETVRTSLKVKECAKKYHFLKSLISKGVKISEVEYMDLSEPDRNNLNLLQKSLISKEIKPSEVEYMNFSEPDRNTLNLSQEDTIGKTLIFIKGININILVDLPLEFDELIHDISLTLNLFPEDFANVLISEWRGRIFDGRRECKMDNTIIIDYDKKTILINDQEKSFYEFCHQTFRYWRNRR